ncbi:MAG: hypothetical protein FJY65_05375 [Calditrichaeota bacterium]|nr:hypothetical protein [Calditrichota bacterium]
MKRIDLIICGFGGQGVIFAGELIGRAGMLAGMESAQSSAYGAEARGSACSTGVVLSDEPIDYPIVRQPDILLAFSQDGYRAYASLVKSGGQIFYDCDLVRPASIDSIEQTGIPATAEAAAIGNKNVANVVMLAKMLAATEILPQEALIKSIIEQSSPAYREINLKALVLCQLCNVVCHPKRSEGSRLDE